DLATKRCVRLQQRSEIMQHFIYPVNSLTAFAVCFDASYADVVGFASTSSNQTAGVAGCCFLLTSRFSGRRTIAKLTLSAQGNMKII
ncbi:hypothetical protein ACO0K2_19210, partial [Undibacterium sp. MH2W]|uniref:hypothetical protein n=1 Tax=Undibacterium sp. MH2W TaxID=3413044 RepID=UPI003BF29825